MAECDTGQRIHRLQSDGDCPGEPGRPRETTMANCASARRAPRIRNSSRVASVVAAPTVTLGLMLDPVGLVFVGSQGGASASGPRPHHQQSERGRHRVHLVGSLPGLLACWSTRRANRPRRAPRRTAQCHRAPGRRESAERRLPGAASIPVREWRTPARDTGPRGPAGCETGGSRQLSSRADPACSASQIIPVIALLSTGEGFQVAAGVGLRRSP